MRVVLDRVSVVLTLAVSVLALEACATSERVVETTSLVGGGVLADLVAGNDSSVVLLYAPDEPLACFDELARWLEVRRVGGLSVLIVLTARPDEGQLLRLRLARIPIDGILDRSTPVPTSAPMAVLFVRGRLASQGGRYLVPASSLLKPPLVLQFPSTQRESS